VVDIGGVRESSHSLGWTVRARVRRAALVLALLGLGVAAGGLPPALAAGLPVTVTNYTDRSEALAWGQRSQWKQPWRSYLDTVPATTLLDAIGINFNVSAHDAAATARLLADAGFKRARIEVGWRTLDYEDPSQMNPGDRESLETTLDALKANGIRPLILLNANSTMPCPVRIGQVNLTSSAPAGATEIHVEPADLATIVPGRTGIGSGEVAASVLFTGTAPDGTVELSKPLEAALPAGSQKVLTLRYEPFRPATLADGEPNPANAATMDGWVNYVRVVADQVRSILGSDQFDVEVWNELSFGSAFLNINSYYEPDVESRRRGSEAEILERTVRFLRDPANGLTGVGIGNGFASESPWPSGSKSPVGLTAIDKHPYAGWRSYPAEAAVNGNRPLNGLGEPSGWRDAEDQYHETFAPRYDDFFPEHFLSGLQTETLVHDLAPYGSTIDGVEHGRYTHPPGGEPPQVWVTEVNLGPGSGPVPRSEMTAAELRRIESKEILRYLVAYVNKGVTAIDFYAAKAGDMSLVDPAFFTALKAGKGAFPGDAAGGETLAAVHRLVAAMHGAGPLSRPRSLRLNELTDFEGNVQFEGDGSAEFPPLYNRDVFAFLPFQVSDDRFVVPVYVMTRNVAEVYPESGLGDRFEMPPEPYRLAIGGVDGDTARVSATDPLSGESVPVEVVSRGSEEVVVQLPVTDSPRLLSIEDDGCEGCDPPAAPETEAEAAEPAAGGGAAVDGERQATPKKSRSAPPAAETALRPKIHLEGQAALLSGGAMTVWARCLADCLLRPRSTLRIDGRSYPASISPADSEVRAGALARSRLRLSIAPRLARLGARTVRQGHRVTLVVSARARPVGSGAAASTRKVAELGS
jgi:hypothetical protein